MTTMDEEKYWERMMEMHGDIREIKTSVGAIKDNCDRTRCILEDHEQRIRVVEKDQSNIFKMVLRPILGVFGIRI